MDFELSEIHNDVRKAARSFAEKEILPRVAIDDREHRFQIDIIRKMGEQGFFGAAFPQEYGGTGLGILVHAIITEEISRAESSLRALFNIQALTCPLTILNFGTEDQKRKYVRRLIRCELLGCNAMTEPDVGSDIAGIKTRAEKKNGCYILNGTKTWISNAPVMDVGVVYVKTDSTKRHEGLSAFIIEAGYPGLTRRELKDKLGHHCSPTGELIFDDCKVPQENLLGSEGEGFRIAMSTLEYGRISVGAGAVGVAQAALDCAVKYCRERKQFGKEIGRFQMVQDKIAQMAVDVEASRLLLHKAAWLMDNGKNAALESSMAKYFSSEAVVKAANYAAELHGAYGYSEEYTVVRLLRDAKMYQVGEGTSHIQKILIANDILGFRPASR